MWPYISVPLVVGLMVLGVYEMVRFYLTLREDIGEKGDVKDEDQAED